jgi:cytosine/adenosine deaminase-related metal-dependent hydrolase
MALKKFQADQLFTGHELLDGNFVLITDEHGNIKDVVDQQDAGDDIQQLTGLLSPGFINCHCHLELSHMRGLILEKTGLVDFVFSIVTQRYFPDEEILAAIAKAEEEMLNNGIVAVGDICNNLLTLSQKKKNNLAYYNFVEASGWLPGIAEQRFEKSKTYYDAYSAIQPTALVPHAPYSVSQNLWSAIQPYFQDKVATIHNQETAFEDQLFLENSGDFLRMYEKMKIDHSFYQPTGKSSLQSYFHQLGGAANALLVHNTFTKEADIVYANTQAATNEQQLYWCLCINANLYIENAVPPVDLLRKNNSNIVLGTDSLASNWSLSIWDEIKSIRKHFPSIELEELLGWATLNGAKALQMDDTIGSFEKGKRPGVILIDNDEVKRLV